MPQALTPEIEQIRSLALASPDVDGLMQAMLVLLENAPDSAVIVGALEDIDPALYQNERLRARIAGLLEKAGRPDLAALWVEPEEPEAALPENVVAFSGVHADARPQPPRLPKENGISFDDIGGLENVKAQVRRKIINPFLNRGLFNTFKRRAGGGVLMYGPPGCGKTMLARALANECEARFIEIRPADVLDQYVGLAEKRIAAMFEEARRNRPVVLFFDEVEALAQRRQFESTARVNTVVSALLNEMDGFAGDNENILFLGATNVPWALDSAFRRPGRFDRTIFVPPPDKVARQFILRGLVRDRPVTDGLDLQMVVERTAGFSGADLAALVETAVDFAIEESGRGDAIRPVSNTHFREALAEVRPSTGDWLGQARSFGEYANQDGLYDDLRDFLKKHSA